MTKKILITMLILLCTTTSNLYSKFDVKVIYFKPVDAADIDINKHTTMLKNIQFHYQSEMTKHGYEDYTFPLEIDRNKKLVISVVNGTHNSNHYNDCDSAYNCYKKFIEKELPFEFNNILNASSRDNVLLVILGGTNVENWHDNIGMGFTWLGNRGGGVALVKERSSQKFPNHYLGLIAHELGHAFGLDPGHNGLNDALNGIIVHFGKTPKEWGNRMKLLKHESDLLKSRPIFRKINIEDEIFLDDIPNKNPELVKEKTN